MTSPAADPATRTGPVSGTAGATIPALQRQERFTSVESTNDVVRAWLAAGEPEICLALADEQTAGRGRNGRTWTAPPGVGLLLSLGFRPTWLAPDRVWRLAATISLAMADAAEEVAGLPDRSVRLKWPNDLVIATDPAGRALDPLATDDAGSAAVVRKLGGVLGETAGLGTDDASVVVGIGLNADWPAASFPEELAGIMTSLRAAAGERPVDLVHLLDAFTSRLETRIEALFGGRFDVTDWVGRQVTTGRRIDLVLPGDRVETVLARGVDALGGGLRIGAPTATDAAAERTIVVGEIRHVRLASV